jgi:hypothetical protein
LTFYNSTLEKSEEVIKNGQSRHWQHWVHKTQDEDKENTKNTTQNLKDEQHGFHQKLSNPLSMSVPEEDYFIIASCELNYVSAFLLRNSRFYTGIILVGQTSSIIHCN